MLGSTGPPSEQPIRPSWRSKPATAVGGPRPAGRKGSGWAEKKDATYQRAAVRHGLRIALWSLLFLSLLASFVAWLVWTPLRTPVIVAVVTNCEAPLPPNAWTQEDAERLQTLDQQEVLKCSTVAWESKELGLAHLRQQLAATVPGGPRKDLVVLYLSLPGAVDEAAEPCLIPPGASPWKSDEWLRVRDLLGRLFPQDSDGKPAAQVKKLLILDAGRMGSDWKFGLLYNSFAERLQMVVQELNVPNLAVLNSTSPGQVGWASPELKGSVFGYFLWQGLNGAADVEQSGNHDKVVSLQELRRYLHAYVGQWVTENRGAAQVPMLLPADADFPVVFRHSSGPTVIPPPGESDPRWPQIAVLWLKHAELARNNPYRLHPLAWEEFQQKLLRLEQLVQAGKAYEDEFNDVRKQAESLAASIEDDRLAGNTAALSLALARQYRSWPSPAEFDRLPAPWKKRPDALAAKAPEPSSRKPTEVPLPPAAEPARPYPYLAAAAATWDWLLANPGSARELHDALQFVDRSQREYPQDVIEVHFLRMLAEHLDSAVWKNTAPIHRAILARQAAEQAAAPADPRVCYAIQPLVAGADADRRGAEDRLFVGAPGELQQADILWTKAAGDNGGQPGIAQRSAVGGYAAAIRRADEISAAFQARDRAWAVLPYLAQWTLARPQAVDTTDDNLRAAIDSVRQLSAMLDEQLEAQQWPPSATALVGQLNGQLHALEDLFQRECADLKTAGEDKHTVRRISAVLTVPLLTGQERNWLRDKQLAIARALAPAGTQYAVTLTTKVTPESIATGDGALDRLRHWAEHPFSLLLDSAAVDTLPLLPSAGQKAAHDNGETSNRGELTRELLVQRLARQGADVRRRLSDLPDAAQLHLRQTATLLADKAPPPPGKVRAGDSQADRLTRAAAAFLDARLRDKLGVDPADPLQRLDLHYLMLWQGDRALADFWGPAPGRDVPYFALVAREYGLAADKLCKGGPPWVVAVEHLEQAARKGVQPSVESKNVFVDEKDASVRHGFAVDVPPNLPRGIATAYIRDSSGLVPLLSEAREPLRRMGLAVAEPGTVRTAEYWIPNEVRLEKADRLQAVALYRGHLRWDDFYVPPSTGLDIVYTKPDYPKPTIVVRGELRQTSAVMFILDCSGSMGAPQVVEGKNFTRLDLARDTLIGILRRLAAPENPYHVGLMIYGHRVGWNPTNTNEVVIRDPRDPRRFLPRPPEMANINPSNDVEVVLPPGPFTKNDFDEVKAKLETLHNMGETPLYLSVIRAIHELRQEASVDQRRIVVITDGVNEQSGGGPDVKYRADVERALKEPGNEGIHLDLVGFQLTTEGEEERKSLRDLQELAASAGGGFHSTQDPTSLLRALQRSLALSQYMVESLPAGQRVTAEPMELNTASVLERPPPQGASYRVRLIDPDHAAEARPTVEGGEALELFVNKVRSTGECRLVYHRYKKDLRDACEQVPAPEDSQRRSFYLAAHLPEWKSTAARFFVSVQNAEAEKFSPRPREAWLQIRPLLPAGQAAGLEYVFYDLQFLPDCPVPVLSCLAPSWPKGATEAEIQVFCKLRETPPDRDLSVRDLRLRPLRLEAAPQVAFEVDLVPSLRAGEPLRVVVGERHPQGGDLYSVKVEMRPLPDKIVHRYNGSTGVIRHSFFFENVAAAEAENYHVLLTTRAKLSDGAIAPPRPLRVTVPVD